MTKKFREGWRIISWRTACLLSALLLHAWAFSSPLPKTDISAPAYQQHSTAVSLSFITPAKEQQTTTDEPKTINKNPVKTVKKVMPTNKKKKQPEKKQPKLVAAPQEASTPKKSATTTETVKEETLATAASTHQQSSSHGIHNAPIISEPLFERTPAPPKYPTVARKRGQQGTVWLEIWLDEWGMQSKLSIMQSSGTRVLDKAALQAVSDWRFKPHQINGQGIASRVRIPVEFALN
ncbi:MAG: energy transducer TonB [Pseudomonadales bacterium]